MATVKAVPEGLSTLTTQLTVANGVEAIEFYKKAFGAEELSRAMDSSGKKVMHATLRIGDSSFYVNDAFPEMGGEPPKPTTFWLFAEGADARFKRAVDAGAEVVAPMVDQFWGDRTGTLKDRWGNRWNIAQHVKDMTPDEQNKAGEEFFKNAPKK